MNVNNNPATKKRLLFICLGNICRSPAAEGVMKSIVEKNGCEHLFMIDSAGIGGWHVGQLPDHRMRKHGAQRGYNFNSHARQFSAVDFDRFDSILVMDSDNYQDVVEQANHPADIKKVKMLTDYLTQHKGVHLVPDPYYGGPSDFDYALDLIEDACQGLFDALMKNND